MVYFSEGNEDAFINSGQIAELIDSLLGKLGNLSRILLLPPDFTRYHSYAGEITCMLYDKLKSSSQIVILPTTGTHANMTNKELQAMYPSIPLALFRKHDWQNDTLIMGTIPAELTYELTGGLVKWPVNCEINRILVDGKWDQIISIGQLVPHELIGIANHNKNILVGAGGKDIIGKTHMIGALYGAEKMIGHITSPVRNILNYMSQNFIQKLPITYLMTVRGPDNNGYIVNRGIFAGDDQECYLEGARLCQQVNIKMLDKDYKKVIAFLDPEEFKSVWVGNKALLRTMMCIADGGELIIICPGIRAFAENSFADSFIRKYGYRSKQELLDIVEKSGEMEDYMLPLSQMILSDTGKRFKVTYAAKDISREELESVYCNWISYEDVIKKYDPESLQEGENILPDGEEIFYVHKPAQGLWSEINRFRRYEQNN